MGGKIGGENVGTKIVSEDFGKVQYYVNWSQTLAILAKAERVGRPVLIV